MAIVQNALEVTQGTTFGVMDNRGNILKKFHSKKKEDTLPLPDTNCKKMEKRRFTNVEVNRCCALFAQAFDRDSFDMMLEARLDKRFEDLVPNTGFKIQLRKVITRANAKYWHYQLLDAATAEVPDDPELLAFAHTFKLTARSGFSLEKLVQHSKILDLEGVLKALARIERQVCRVESPPHTAVGTGFLVAKDLVLTNYHVLEPLQKAQITKEHVAFRFDYRTNLENELVSDGTVSFPKEEGALVQGRKYHQNDIDAAPLDSDWPEGDLDFALIRLSESIGEQPAGALSKPELLKNTPARGWIAPVGAAQIEPGAHLFIAQHPKQEPISIAFGTLSTPSANGNLTRIRYNTSTLPGSSGSPCFDGEFNLLALHHASDASPGQWGKTNQGIPIQSILNYLQVQSFEEI